MKSSRSVVSVFPPGALDRERSEVRGDADERDVCVHPGRVDAGQRVFHTFRSTCSHVACVWLRCANPRECSRKYSRAVVRGVKRLLCLCLLLAPSNVRCSSVRFCSNISISGVFPWRTRSERASERAIGTGFRPVSPRPASAGSSRNSHTGRLILRLQR